MKRPDKYQYLKYGINAAQIMAEYDRYCDYLEAQLKEERKASYWYYCNSFTNEDIDTDKLLEYDKRMEEIENLKP